MGKDKDKDTDKELEIDKEKEKEKDKNKEKDKKKEKEKELERIFLLNKLYMYMKRITSNKDYSKYDFSLMKDYINLLDTNDEYILNLYKFACTNHDNFINLYDYLINIIDIDCIIKLIEFFKV